MSEWFDSDTAPTDEHIDGWREYLAEFQRDMLPVFQSYGFTPGEAFVAWQLQRIIDQLLDLESAVEGDG